MRVVNTHIISYHIISYHTLLTTFQIFLRGSPPHISTFICLFKRASLRKVSAINRDIVQLGRPFFASPSIKKEEIYPNKEELTDGLENSDMKCTVLTNLPNTLQRKTSCTHFALCKTHLHRAHCRNPSRFKNRKLKCYTHKYDMPGFDTLLLTPLLLSNSRSVFSGFWLITQCQKEKKHIFDA